MTEYEVVILDFLDGMNHCDENGQPIDDDIETMCVLLLSYHYQFDEDYAEYYIKY